VKRRKEKREVTHLQVNLVAAGEAFFPKVIGDTTNKEIVLGGVRVNPHRALMLIRLMFPAEQIEVTQMRKHRVHVARDPKHRADDADREQSETKQEQLSRPPKHLMHQNQHQRLRDHHGDHAHREMGRKDDHAQASGDLRAYRLPTKKTKDCLTISLDPVHRSVTAENLGRLLSVATENPTNGYRTPMRTLLVQEDKKKVRGFAHLKSI
jgi:hypothetical protein